MATPDSFPSVDPIDLTSTTFLAERDFSVNDGNMVLRGVNEIGCGNPFAININELEV